MQVIVRQEKGDFDGGSCRIEGEKYIFLKKSASDAEKIDILMRELANLDSSDTEIDPAVRDYLDRLRQETDDNVAV
ncbi:hypothetical protein JXA70_08825 [candidate division KSB1 bacterium]|nr:hypothetical protein [candidate division KSB1 bacterium]